MMSLGMFPLILTVLSRGSSTPHYNPCFWGLFVQGAHAKVSLVNARTRGTSELDRCKQQSFGLNTNGEFSTCNGNNSLTPNP